MTDSDKKILEYRGINWRRRLLIYGIGLSSLAGTIIGVLKVTMHWSEGLTFVVGAVCGTALFVAALREDLAEDFGWLFSRHRHDRHA